MLYFLRLFVFKRHYSYLWGVHVQQHIQKEPPQTTHDNLSHTTTTFAFTGTKSPTTTDDCLLSTRYVCTNVVLLGRKGGFFWYYQQSAKAPIEEIENESTTLAPDFFIFVFSYISCTYIQHPLYLGFCPTMNSADVENESAIQRFTKYNGTSKFISYLTTFEKYSLFVYNVAG